VIRFSLRTMQINARRVWVAATGAGVPRGVRWPRAHRVLVRAASAACIGVALAGCQRADGDARAEEVLRDLDLVRRVSQMVMVALPPGGTWSGPEVGGFWVTTGDPAWTLTLATAAGPDTGLPTLVGADVDEGLGASIAGATAFPPFSRMISTLGVGDLREIGGVVAREGRVAGVNFGLVRGPPLRGGPDWVGLDEGELGQRVAAFVDGGRRGGMSMALQVFWSPDRAPAPLDRAWLEVVDLPLLRAAAADGGAAALLPGSGALPALTGEETPLPFSTTAMSGVFRRDIGWDGVVLVDLRGMAAADRPDAALRAVAAGADLVLIEGDAVEVIEHLLDAVGDGRVPAGRVEAAARRVLRVRASLPEAGRGPADADPEDRLPAPGALALAARATETAVTRLTAAPWPGRGGRALVLTPGGRGGTFAAALARHVPVDHVPLNLTADPAALAAVVRDEIARSAAVVYLDFPGPAGADIRRLIEEVPAEEREGRSIFRVALRHRADEDLMASPPEVLAWGVGGTSQIRAARVLAGEATGEGGGHAATLPARVLREVPPASVGLDPAILRAADAAVEAALGRGVFTAAALAVGRGGGLVTLRGFGSLPDGSPVDPASTVFDVASLTKVVATTSAVAALVDSGALDLDAPVRQYVREFEGGEKNAVTVRQLLTHTSGLPPGLALYSSASSSAQALEQVIRQPLRRSPGVQAEYSDLGMILLAEVIERASGESLDRLLARRVFGPLGMTSTLYLPPLAFHTRIVPTAIRSERPFPLQGVVHDGNAFRLGGVTGHAGLFSTAPDLAVFAQTMLNGGSYGLVDVFRDSTVRSFVARQPGADSRAIGWDTPEGRSSAGRFFSARSFGHTGYTGTSLWIDPEQDLFVVLLTNRTYSRATTAAMLQVRIAVHEAVSRAIADRPVTMRRGAR
jgi:CubicO group peptidase (beta-lactamase class C family)